MARGIGSLDDEWEEAFHSKWGSFNRQQTCRTSTIGLFGHYARSVRSGGTPDACCGEEGEKWVF